MLTIENIEEQIKSNDAVLLYFSGENCGVCEALKPKIQSSFNQYFPKIKQIYIEDTNNKALYAHFNIFTVPSILIFFESKETRRLSRHISVDNLIIDLKRPYELFFN